MKFNREKKGFTLVELLVYVGVFSIVSVFLTGILITTLRVQDKNVSGNEVSSQLDLVLQTTQRLVRESSLIEDVFEGTTPVYDANGELTNPCVSSYCSVQLRMEESNLDPTIIRSDSSTKQVYLKQGEGVEEPITNSRVTVDSLVFTKNEISGAHATLQVDATISYVGTLSSTRSGRAVVGRVSAATFDSHLIPNTDNAFDVGQTVGNARWKNGNFSENLTVGDYTGSPNLTLSGGDDPNSFGIKLKETSENYGASIIFHNDVLDFLYHNNNSAGISALAISRVNGNVGIGTTAPGQKLVVAGGTNGRVRLKIDEALNNYGKFEFSTSDSSTASADMLAEITANVVAANPDPLKTSLSFATNRGDNLVGAMTIDELGNVGIGTASPSTKLTVVDNGESTTQTNLTQAVTNAGLLVQTEYNANAFTPGLFWVTSNNNPTKPKAGIYLKETGSGTNLYFGTSNNYAIGITNDAIIIDPSGNTSIAGNLIISGTCTGCGGGSGGNSDFKSISGSGTTGPGTYAVVLTLEATVGKMLVDFGGYANTCCSNSQFRVSFTLDNDTITTMTASQRGNKMNFSGGVLNSFDDSSNPAVSVINTGINGRSIKKIEILAFHTTSSNTVNAGIYAREIDQ